MNHEEIIQRLIPCVLQAGDKIMEIYSENFDTQYKKDGSPITEADYAAEKIILAELNRINANILVISEENQSSHIEKPKDTFFLVDALDGTKEFLNRKSNGGFTVNIGLIENKIPVLGIVYAPALRRLFYGSIKSGAREKADGKTKVISVKKSENKGLVAVASASHRDKETNNWLKKKNIETIVSIGSSLKFCLVATGEADVYPRFSPTMEWDTAAGDAILRAAGGTITEPDLSEFNYGKSNYINGPFIAWGKV